MSVVAQCHRAPIVVAPRIISRLPATALITSTDELATT
jgi:hypothetical protein